MGKITGAVLRRLRLPLHTPYRLSYRTFEEFEPYLIEIFDDEGASGFADGHISPGSSSETRDGGWQFCKEHIRQIIGSESDAAKAAVLEKIEDSKVAGSVIVSAIEVLEGTPFVEVLDDVALPLLTPTSASTPETIIQEVETRLAEGYRCMKIKVGKDVDYDLARVRAFQDALAGRGTLRLDANRAYSQSDGERFAASLQPDGIELFEQPCEADDWKANAAVAKASTVPLMLDEPICSPDDIERAATLEGVGFCKLKLKRFGSLQRLADSLELVRARGMQPVLGDGLGSDVHAWLEACVARTHISNAGEFNGYLKTYDRLLAEPPEFRNGEMLLKAGQKAALDCAAVERLTVEKVAFGDCQSSA